MFIFKGTLRQLHIIINSINKRAHSTVLLLSVVERRPNETHQTELCTKIMNKHVPVRAFAFHLLRVFHQKLFCSQFVCSGFFIWIHILFTRQTLPSIGTIRLSVVVLFVVFFLPPRERWTSTPNIVVMESDWAREMAVCTFIYEIIFVPFYPRAHCIRT